MNRIFSVFLVVAIVTLTGCVEDDNYVVATRNIVDRSTFPALDEMNWRGQRDLDLFVVSEAHAKVLPEVDWPGPIGEMMGLVVTDAEGNLPERWDLPIDDRCLYVGVDRRRPSWRFQHLDRTLFFLPYRVTPSTEKQKRSSGYYLAAIDESQGLERYDFSISSPDVLFVDSNQQLLVIERDDNKLLLRKVIIEGRDVVLSEPSVLLNSARQIKAWTVDVDPTRQVHLAWSVHGESGSRSSPAFYARFDGEAATEGKAIQLTESSTGKVIDLVFNDGAVFVAWQDSRFLSGLVGIQNASKLFFSRVDWGSQAMDRPIVVNQPYDESDTTSDPVFAIVYRDRLYILWSTTSTGDFKNADLRFSALDYDDRSLALADLTVGEQDILGAAIRQMRQAQRSNPVGNHLAPSEEECDDWEDKVKSLPLLEAGPIDIHGRPVPLIEGSTPLIKKEDEESDGT
jgi:hypothetical protein